MLRLNVVLLAEKPGCVNQQEQEAPQGFNTECAGGALDP